MCIFNKKIITYLPHIYLQIKKFVCIEHINACTYRSNSASLKIPNMSNLMKCKKYFLTNRIDGFDIVCLNFRS